MISDAGYSFWISDVQNSFSDRFSLWKKGEVVKFRFGDIRRSAVLLFMFKLKQVNRTPSWFNSNSFKVLPVSFRKKQFSPVVRNTSSTVHHYSSML